jgi:DNA-binding response OmpR family regulator
MSAKKVLVVDDDVDLLQGLRVLLKAKGYEVVFATDGLSSINTARMEMPDVIILDIGLPAGDGFVVMNRLKSMQPLASIPIIILTAMDPSSCKERALNEGAKFFFQKPFDNDELLGAIRNATGESGGNMQEQM